MAISFMLSLTPNQIEFLQQLDLYADGVIPITAAGNLGGRDNFIIWTRKLIRDGLVQHVEPVPGKTRYEGQVGGGEVILAYRITEKGRTVLGLIQSDVEAFLARQKLYQETKRNGQRRRA